MNKLQRLSTFSKVVVILVFLFLLFNVSLYYNQRRQWVNKDHAYLDAKEYLAFGIVVNFYKRILLKVVDIDNPIVTPLNRLHDLVMQKGFAFIPESDGERAMWRQLFYYGFCNDKLMMKDGLPVGFGHISPRRVKMLDDVYRNIEEMARPIADKEINEIRFIIFPLFVSFYERNQLWYYGNTLNESARLALVQDKEKIERNAKLIQWLVDFQAEWEKYPSVQQRINRFARVLDLFHWLTVERMTENMVFEKLTDLTFSCDDYHVGLYLKSRGELLKALEKHKGKTAERILKRIHEIAFKSDTTKDLVYHLNKYCNIPKDEAFPDDAWISNKAGKGYWNYDHFILKSANYKCNLK